MNLAVAGFRHGHIMDLYRRAKASEAYRVVGAWEADDEARVKAQETVTEPFYESLNALLSDPRVDAVAVGDFYGARGEIIIRALKAGKDVISDKPVCVSPDELKEIRRLVTEGKRRFVCMLDLRYDAAVRKAREMALSGCLGRIHAAAFTGQHPLNWGVRPKWYFEDGRHGGTINDLAVHGIDAVRYMTGLNFVRATAARTWNAFAAEAPDFCDCAQMMVEFDGGMGLIADVSYSVVSKSPAALPMYWRFTLWGDAGTLELKFGDGFVLYAGKDSEKMEKIECEPVADSWLSDLLKPYDEDEVNDVFDSLEATLMIQKAADEAKKGM